MSRRTRLAVLGAMVLVCLTPAAAAAQDEAADTASGAAPHTGWFVFGGAPTTVRGDCTFCEVEGREANYLHTWSLVADAGVRMTSRLDTGLEVAWVPATTVAGDTFRTTFVVGVAQFRPWESQGFFVKAGMGMAFVRNWLFSADTPITQKALAVVIGGGWAFRPEKRVGFQLYAAQHAAALGDFETREGALENVMGNLWSLGAAVVIR